MKKPDPTVHDVQNLYTCLSSLFQNDPSLFSGKRVKQLLQKMVDVRYSKFEELFSSEPKDLTVFTKI